MLRFKVQELTLAKRFHLFVITMLLELCLQLIVVAVDDFYQTPHFLSDPTHSTNGQSVALIIRTDASRHLRRLRPPGQVITDQGAEEDVPVSSSVAQDALLEAMSPFENYINGMLTNYKQLPLDRLHKMLQLFVISPK